MDRFKSFCNHKFYLKDTIARIKTAINMIKFYKPHLAILLEVGISYLEFKMIKIKIQAVL